MMKAQDMRICSECGHEYNALEPHECVVTATDLEIERQAKAAGMTEGEYMEAVIEGGRKPKAKTTRQTSIQLTEATERQVKALQSFGSFTDVVRIAIDRMYRDEYKPVSVNLIETNAGGLFIGFDNGPWYDMTQVDSTFDADAVALINGDTDNWTVDRYDVEPDGELVGEWAEGALRLRLASGIAARRYMGLPSRA